MKNKTGFFFSMDALIALMVIVIIILAVYLPIKTQYSPVTLHEDTLKILSTLKVGEIDSDYVRSLILSGKISDLNNSILEQIGEFYAVGDPLAKDLAKEMLEELNPRDNIAIYFNNQFLAGIENLPFEEATNTWIARQTISGIEEGPSVKGYTARAFLSKNHLREFFYFGGYVGDGNLSLNLEYFGEIKDASLELAINGDFDLYINGNFISTFSKPETEFTPETYSLTEYLGNFNSGLNEIEIKSASSVDNLLYIAGGYLSIDYETSGIYQTRTKKYLPGVEGLINIYDSFYVPTDLESIDIYLHYNSLYDVFMTIGNTTVYREDSNGIDKSITLTDAELSSLLDYSSMNQKTIPIRLGLESATYVFNQTLYADVFSVTDLSGSMCGSCVGGDFWCCLFRGCTYNEWDCNYCGGTCSEDKMDNAKEADINFVNYILNYSGNRVGLIGYRDSFSPTNFHELSNDNESLISEVDTWYSAGGTCICCGVNEAVNQLITDSDSSKFRSMVVMSDGQSNVQCSEQGTGDANLDAVQAACDAYNNYGIKIYTVGFGENADEATLQSMAECGDGSYYYSEVEDLVQIYEQVAEEIIAASYYEQTAEAVGDIYTVLYPDSYIEIDYQSTTIPYGLILTAESNGFGDDGKGTFSVPQDAEILEANALSYSGSKWTSNVFIQNNLTPTKEIFNLGEYGQTFLEIGDPYVVNIPSDEISKGENNISIFIGLSAENSTLGSEHNKIIYTLVKQALSYSKICASSIGCSWNVSFEDGSDSIIKFPSEYSGYQQCSYSSEGIFYNENDALSEAVYKLFRQLDFEKNGKVNVKLSENDLKISSVEVQGVPFSVQSEAQIRVWR